MLPAVLILAIFSTAAEAKNRPRQQSPQSKACWGEVNRKLPTTYERLPDKRDGVVRYGSKDINKEQRQAMYAECMDKR